MTMSHKIALPTSNDWMCASTSERALHTHKSLNDRICRVFDIVLTLPLLIFILPTMVVVALACWAQDGGPMVYAQPRIGRNGKMFRCFKFRSMVTDSEQRLRDLLDRDPIAAAEWAATQKLENDPRITRWGRFIRKSSLDELPQLLNVLAGQMSLVGPRPIVAAEAVRYGNFLSAYLSVRPGITGLWQVSGRSSTSYRRRVAMDVAFTRNRSAILYLKILIATVPSVLFQRGAR